ncbi:MAG: porin family protein [Bacteroidota bacterium]
MKKLILVLAASFLIVQVSKAELFEYGAKIGLGYSSLKVSDLTGLNNGTDVYDLVTGDGVMAYHIGVMTRVKIAMLYVQPELYFNDGGGTIERIVDNVSTGLMTVDFQRVDIPIMAGAKFGPLRVNAGPVGSYVVKESITTDIADIPPDYEVFHKSMTWGFQAGLGLDLSKISFDARYEGSLSKLGESLNVGGNDYALDARPSQWVFSLGFWF